MRLVKVNIDSFKTIAASRDLTTDQKITTLVGANEVGKTNLLQAIMFMSNKEVLKREHITKSNSDRVDKKTLPCFTFHFNLSKEETVALGLIVPDLINEKTLTIKRSGNELSTYSVILPSAFDQKFASFQNDLLAEEKELEGRIKAISSEIDLISKEITNKSRQYGDVIPTDVRFNLAKMNKRYTDSRSAIVEEEYKLSKIQVKIKDLTDRRLHAAKMKEFLIADDLKGKLLDLLPRVVYINNLSPIPGSLPIKDIKEQKSVEAILVGNLLKIGGFSNFDDLDDERRQINLKLGNISKLITEKINKFYSNEKEIQFLFEKETTDLDISINGGISVTSSPMERSEGFQWLLSFFAQFGLESTDMQRNLIFLFDEPALHLHPSGQKDVLKLLEKLSENNQIVYTTHSPFLINKNFPHRLRVVTKDSKEGTLINEKPYKDSTTRCWAPLKSSLGICLGDLFSIGDELNSIVEGVSDHVIIAAVSNKLAALNEPFIDLDNVTIVSANGVSCQEYLARYTLAEGLNAISFLDNDTAGRNILEVLSKEKDLKIITVNMLKETAVTIEDLLPSDFFEKAVNAYYSKFNYYKEFKIIDYPLPKGIIGKLHQHLISLGRESIEKVGIANELILLIENSTGKNGEYDPFKQLFVTINDYKLKTEHRKV